jgi:antitoxin (DNA-binding transcriptional repressor) of toxin-antitoxin stability system
MPAERKIGIAELKAHLSAEIKRVRSGGSITILDHKQPVAKLTGLESGLRYVRRARRPFVWKQLPPLLEGNIGDIIDAERADSW